MKICPISAALVAVTFTAPLSAADPQRLPSGLEFHLPAGWQINVSGQGAVLIPPGHDRESELYFTGLSADLVSIDDSKALTAEVVQFFPNLKPTPTGAPVAFTAAGGKGMAHTFDGSFSGITAKVKLYLVALPGHGAAALAAVAKSELLQSRTPALNALAASFRFPASPTPAAPRANNLWTQRLNDKKLVQFSGYSSGGNSGGMNSQKTLYLSADGTYSFRSSSSISIDVSGASASSGGRQANQGRWRVVEQAGEATLELTSPQNGIEKIKLTLQGTQTFLNGRRWFVTGINE